MKKIILALLLVSNFSFLKCVVISESEKAYYQQNPWDFIDNLTIKYPEDYPTGFEVLPYILMVSAFVGTYIGWQKIFKTSDLSKERKVEKRLFGNFFGAMFGALFALMTWELSTEVINRLTIDDRLFGVLKWFMNNYNPDLNIKSDKNLKKCLPEGLYSTFDNMYLEYLKNGDKYLRNRALEIVRNLRSKIMYEIKKEEYKKPKVVNVYNSSYSHPIYTYPTYRYSRYGY